MSFCDTWIFVLTGYGAKSAQLLSVLTWKNARNIWRRDGRSKVQRIERAMHKG